MPDLNQPLSCSKGDTYPFMILIDRGPDGNKVPGMEGATFEWVLAEGQFDRARRFITKTGNIVAVGETADDWGAQITLSPAETLIPPSGDLYHRTKITMADGTVITASSGRFDLMPTI